MTKDFFNLILDFGDNWVVTKVETDHTQYEIYLYVEYKSDHYEDPDTLELASLYDHSEQREWRHLDILHYKTYIRCRIPRVKCKDGSIKQISVGWASKHDRHSYLFEIKVIELLKATKNQTKTAEFMQCGFRLVNRILHRSVSRGLERRDYKEIPFEHISLDEKSFKKGHQYVTVLSHPKSGIVLDVGDGRSETVASDLLKNSFTPSQLEAVNTVSMDMWQSFINTAHRICPHAEIVHDKFHLISYLTKSIDQVRRREVKQNDALINARYTLLKREENLTEKQRAKFELIKTANFEVSKAWHIRENFTELFEMNNNEKDAFELFMHWAQDAIVQNIKEVNKVIVMFGRHIRGVINALISNLNNAMAERLNGKIQEIKLVGRGYRLFPNFRSAILFFHGGLDLYPRKW